jgi:hypothetical protein
MIDIDLSELTFIISLRVDSREREENLRHVINYYRPYGINVIIGEEDVQQRMDMVNISAEHLFYKSQESFFYRTRILNSLLKKVRTPFVANYDCDVIFPVAQLNESIKLLRSGSDIVYPYEGHFVDVERRDIHKIVDGNFNVKSRIINPHSIGGAVVFKTEVYRKGGGENENFISWSPEDLERYERFSKLGYKISRVVGKCYHMTHPRGINSDYSNPYWSAGEEELNRVRCLNKSELIIYIEKNRDKFYNEHGHI